MTVWAEISNTGDGVLELLFGERETFELLMKLDMTWSRKKSDLGAIAQEYADICDRYADAVDDSTAPTVAFPGFSRDELDSLAVAWALRAASLRGSVGDDGFFSLNHSAVTAASSFLSAARGKDGPAASTSSSTPCQPA